MPPIADIHAIKNTRAGPAVVAIIVAGVVELGVKLLDAGGLAEGALKLSWTGRLVSGGAVGERTSL